MRNLLLFDKVTTSRKQDIENALLKIRDDYSISTPVTWEYEERDFTTLVWTEYLPNAMGISFDTVNADTQAIYLRDGEKWDNVIYVVDPSNWKAPGIGGWNLGSPRHGYCVQIVIASTNPEWMHKIFAMEIAHSWNDLCIQELNDNLLSTFDVQDFDNGVVHGCDPKYGVNVPLNAPMTGYYTNYDYRPEILMIKDKLALAYKTRLDRYTNGTYKFTRDLYFGMSGDDVVELQKRMVREGLATYKPTGYFGVLTKGSVIAYQQKHGITPSVGYCGPKTRMVLNGSIVTPFTVPHAEVEAILLSELAMWD